MLSGKRNKILLVICAFNLYMLVETATAFAQSRPKDDFILMGDVHFGYIITQRQSVAHLIKGQIGGGELTYVFRTCGQRSWQPLHAFPEFGLSYMHLYLANPSEIGNLDALYPYMNLRLNKQKRNFKMYLRLGLGLANMSKPFDRLTNPKNNAIGSHLNGYVNIRLSSSYMLSKSWRLDSGIGLTHASNGSIKTPNLGLNMATLNLGLGYVFGNKNLEMCKDSVMPKLTKRWHPSVLGVFGFKELEHPLGNKYMSYALCGNLYYSLNHKNRLGTAVEFVYSNETRVKLERDSASTERIKDVIKIGVKGGYAFHVDRISIPIDFGYYVYQNDNLKEKFFHRIGVRYMVTKHVIANVTLYTHWAKADYFEWGMGYEF